MNTNMLLIHADPFSVHFEQDLQDEEAEELSKILPLSLKYQHSLVSHNDAWKVQGLS